MMASGQLRTIEDINLPNQDEESFVTLQVTNLPFNTFEGPLRKAIEKVVPVAAVHVPVSFLTGKIHSRGYLVLRRKHSQVLLKQRYILFRGTKLYFNNRAPSKDLVDYAIKIKQDTSSDVALWAKDVRPGHPDYRLPAVSEEPFDLDPPEPDKPSAHILVDDVLHLVFKNLKLCDLLRIERTCRRWQWIVRKLLMGHTLINFGDVHSLWGDFEGIDDYAHSMLLEKAFILNGETLEHLIIYNMNIASGHIRRAVMQCCPKISHYFEVTRVRSRHTYAKVFLPLVSLENSSYLVTGST